MTERKHNRIASVFVLLALLLATTGSRAQDELPPTETEPEGTSSEPVATPEPQPETPAAPDPRDEKIEALEKKLDEQQKSFDERLSAVEEIQEDQLLGELPTGFEPSFDVYGFFDMSFNKFVTEEGSFFRGVLHEDSTFFVQNLNLYFKSEMTESLSAIAELGFTFAPTGQEKEIEMEGFSDFEREDTEVVDLFSAGKERLGGVHIERVHLTWRPSDYFGVIAGRFLTPYGIWNIEHGSPVLIPIRPPFMLTSQFIPSAQTGFVVLGDFHPKPGHKIHYAITLSNGRGPMDEVYDLDSNTAAGLRLRYTFDNPNARFSLGGYGYTGEYTDKYHRIVSVAPIGMDYYVNEQYREWIGSLDVLFESHGFRAQVEYVRRLVTYNERPLREMKDGGGYPPDYVGQGAFGLLAYTLPIADHLGGVAVTPYVSGEYTEANDTKDQWAVILAGGLNVRPSPHVALKVEYYRSTFPEWHKDEVEEGTMAKEDEGESFWGIAAQIAVSF